MAEDCFKAESIPGRSALYECDPPNRIGWLLLRECCIVLLSTKRISFHKFSASMPLFISSVSDEFIFGDGLYAHLEIHFFLIFSTV